MKAYFDNCIESGRWREQDRTKDPTRRAQLAESRGATPVVPNDHKLLGFHNQMDRLGTVAVTPFITEIIDEGLFKSLTTAGLKDADARHLMYAAGNGCDRFVRLDNRHRNKDGEISHKHGNTLIRTLRKIYGQGFDQYSRRISNPNLRKETFFSSRWDQDKRWQIPSWPS